MVKLRSDQQRVKALLKETITLLCKNGLEYKSHFCVDALIGITLDEEDVFLVKISETVSDGKSVCSEAPVHPLPLHMPPTAPSYDIQMMSDSRFPPAQTEPISLSTKTVIPTPPPPAHSANRKSPTPRKQPTPQPLKNERKRRASSSPAREAAPSQPPSNIPEQPTTTPGASSYLSEHSNQSSLSNSMNMEPERPNSVEREEPGLVRDIAIKDEFSASETENENEGPEQDMPLNMSKSSSSKESTGAAPTIPGCSGWDPAHLQQQVAQAAAAALSTGDSSTPPTPDMAKTPENGEQQDDDSQWSMLKSALKTKQKGGRKPNEEDGVDYFYTIAQPQYSLEKRYVCDFDGCNYTSSRKYNLMRHGRTHHEDQRIPCPECPGTFVDKYILKEHMAAAHPKFTVPIEGTNMIGVGIGTTNMPGTPEEQADAKRRRMSQVGAQGQPRPEGSPVPGRRTPKQKTEQQSPGASKRKSNGGVGWHIPRLGPMDEAVKAEQRKAVSAAAAAAIGEKGKEAIQANIPRREPAFINIEPSIEHNSSPEANNNNNNKPYESSLSLASSMQAVFPGMDMMSLADDPEITNNNNNNVKEVESVDPPSDLSAGMQVVFPGMEMVADDSNGAAEQDADDSLKDRSVIETSDGEEVKVSE